MEAYVALIAYAVLAIIVVLAFRKLNKEIKKNTVMLNEMSILKTFLTNASKRGQKNVTLSEQAVKKLDRILKKLK